MTSGRPRAPAGRRGAARQPTAHRDSAPPAVQYIESSALVAAILEADARAQQAIRAPGLRITSVLTLAETHRAVLRGRLAGRFTADDERAIVRGLRTFARRAELVAVSDEVLLRAGQPFPIEPIRTLDAIHLATIELLGEPPQLVTVVTRDRRVGDNARALGYAVV